MDEITKCIPEKDVIDLVNAIGKTMNGQIGGTCALALCRCLSVVMKQTGVPFEFVTDILKQYVEMEEKDETAH